MAEAFKFDILDTVKVINTGDLYSTYDSWAKLSGYYKEWIKDKPILQVGQVGRVLFKAKHETYKDLLYLVEIDNRHLYIIGEDGLILHKKGEIPQEKTLTTVQFSKIKPRMTVKIVSKPYDDPVLGWNCKMNITCGKKYRVEHVLKNMYNVPILHITGNDYAYTKNMITEVYDEYGKLYLTGQIDLASRGYLAGLAVDESTFISSTLGDNKKAVTKVDIATSIIKPFTENTISTKGDNNMNFIKAIDKVIYNKPATIVLWADGSKTTAKCAENETFDPEKGLIICALKKFISAQSVMDLLQYVKPCEKGQVSYKDILNQKKAEVKEAKKVSKTK